MPFKAKINWEEEVPYMREVGASGGSMVSLSEKYGVSRQRIKQVVDKYLPEWEDNYGRAVARKERERTYKAKWGERQHTDLYRVQREKFSRKKANATKTGWEWSITFGELDWPTHCPILGMELDYFLEYRAENSPSFDQIDSGKGYIPGNVQIISWRANRIKNDGNAEEHQKIADYLKKITQR